MPYAKVIVNPAAGAGKTGRCWPDIMDCLLYYRLDFDYTLTSSRGEAEELATTAAKQGYPVVVSVGGDGTVNEVANGLMRNGHRDGVSLGIITTGTGSDYVRTIGLPRDYVKASQRLSSPKRMAVDVGIVECTDGGKSVSRYFVNSAGLGMDAEMARAATGKLKALGSKLAYMAGFFKTFLTYRNHDLQLRLNHQDEKLKACSVLVSNGRYGGGGMCPVPHAEPSDGQFDVLVIGDVSKAEMLRLLPRFYKGTHLGQAKIRTTKATEVRVRPLQAMHVQADGELLGVGPAEFRIIPRALSIIV